MIHNILLKSFPDYKAGDWHLRNESDGKGDYISEWNRVEPQPTLAEINAAMPLARADEAKVAVNTPILAQMAKLEHEILCQLCDSNPEYAALKAQLQA